MSAQIQDLKTPLLMMSSVQIHSGVTKNHIIRNQTITLICKEYHTNYLWLTEEKGEQESDNSDAQAIVDSVMKGDNEFAKSVLVKFAKLSEDHWKQIENILNELEKN